MGRRVVVYMAKAPGHALGEKIGQFLEDMVIDSLKQIAEKSHVYCDYKHERKARNNAAIVSWRDIDGNKHDLDIVYERHGSEERFGKPCAFIEVAWRRYTKHSKNKVQEIAGAILPIVNRFKDIAPFYGVVLAGEFTQNAIKQLDTEGFSILYFTTKDIFSAFFMEGIDISFDEKTSDQELEQKVLAFDALSNEMMMRVKSRLIELKKDDISRFKNALIRSLERRLEKIKVLSLYGSSKEFYNADSAYAYIRTTPSIAENEFNRFEIECQFSNGDRISLIFHDKQPALVYLASLNE